MEQEIKEYNEHVLLLLRNIATHIPPLRGSSQIRTASRRGQIGLIQGHLL